LWWNMEPRRWNFTFDTGDVIGEQKTMSSYMYYQNC
jgi:hypothetical protein